MNIKVILRNLCVAEFSTVPDKLWLRPLHEKKRNIKIEEPDKTTVFVELEQSEGKRCLDIGGILLIKCACEIVEFELQFVEFDSEMVKHKL